MPDTVPAARPTIKAHYPFITRTLIELYNAGELPAVQSVLIEPEYGYVGRLVHRDGQVRMFRATRLDLNRNGAAEIAHDKGYTKFFLQELGYVTPRGRVFLLPHYIQLIDRNLSRYQFADYPRIGSIFRYIDEEISYPCYLKPNDGAQGRDVARCTSAGEVMEVLQEYQEHRVNVLLVEEAIAMPDFRVLVLRGELIACYLRQPLSVTGDGRQTVRDLLRAHLELQSRAGRPTLIEPEDPWIAHALGHSGITLDSVPAANEVVQVADVSNLSMGGAVEDWTERIHPYWREFCIRLTAELGLDFCGIDLACTDITRPDAAYTILEMNAAPGLDHFATIGPAQARLVRDTYRRIFNQEIFA